MTIQEQHVRVELQLSQVNSDRRRSFEPEEIDIALNTVIGQFVSARTKQYLGGDQQSVEDLATLVMVDKEVKLYKAVMDNTFFGVLPGDMKELLHARFRGKRLCGKPAPTLTSTSVPVYRLVLPKTAKESANFYQAFRLTVNGAIVFDITATKLGATGITDKDAAFTLEKQLIQAAERNGVNYEGFSFVGAPHIFYSLLPFNILVDAVTSTATTTGFTLSTYPAQTQTIFAEAISPLRVAELLATPFYGPNKVRLQYYESTNQSLNVNSTSDVILDAGIISYVRKPAIVDLVLGIDCDLPDNRKVHEHICTMAVRHLMGFTGDERYPVIAKEEAVNANNNRG